jgi:hypothetical protein
MGMTYKVKKNQKRYKSEKCWEIDIRLRLPNKEHYRERYKSKASTKIGAETEAADREAYLIRNGPEQSDTAKEELKRNTTFKVFYEDFFLKRGMDDLSQSYLDWMQTSYRSRLAPTFDDMTLSSITTEVINDFRRKLRNPIEGEGKPMGKKACNNLLVFLGGVLKSAKEQKLIEELPAISGFKILKEKVSVDGVNCYSEEQLARLVVHACAISSDAELVVLLGADAGLRFGEILGVIPSEDVKQSNGEWTLTVARSVYRNKQGFYVKAPKNGKPRQIPLTPRLQKALALRMRIKGYALQDEQGAPLTPRVVKTWIGRAQKAARLEGTERLHVLRHTFCSRLALKGMPLKVIQALADHANISTTERYLHSDQEMERRAIAALSPSTDSPTPPANRGTDWGQKKLKVVSG